MKHNKLILNNSLQKSSIGFLSEAIKTFQKGGGLNRKSPMSRTKDLGPLFLKFL